MKTLLLVPELFAGEGGIMRILRLYLKAVCELSVDGDEVRIVSLNDGPEDTAELRNYSNEKLVDWRFCGSRKFGFCLAALRMGLASDRIICGHIGQLPVAWVLSGFRPRLSYYLVAHGIEVWRSFSFLERRALEAVRCVFCVSEYTRRRLLENCSLSSKQTAVLPNALDPCFEKASPRPASKDSKIVLAISRLSIADSYKGIEHLVKAMPAVRAAVPKARLRVVGQGDGLPGLMELERGLNLSEAVEFVGYLNDSELSREFERCSLFALPSEKEGFGIVFLEAMAHGRPCLGARSGGVPEVITPDTGVLVDYGDVSGIASALIGSLNRDWQLGPLLERARVFSYSRFKEFLGSLLQGRRQTRESSE